MNSCKDPEMYKYPNKRNKYQSKYEDSSSSVTKRRLIRYPGIFRKGKSTGPVVRDPSISEETLARAEKSLSLILQTTSFKKLESEIISQCKEERKSPSSAGPSTNNFLKRRRSKGTSKAVHKEKRFSPSLTSTLRNTSLSSPPISPGIQVGKNIPGSHSEASSASLKGKGAGKRSSEIKKTSEDKENKKGKDDEAISEEDIPQDIDYEAFAMCIDANLEAAAKMLDSDPGIESILADELRDAYQHRCSSQLNLTPPSGPKSISHYLKEFESSIDASSEENEEGLKREQELNLGTPSSSSAISLPFDVTVCPPTLVTNPRGLIKRYEEKRKEDHDINQNLPLDTKKLLEEANTRPSLPLQEAKVLPDSSKKASMKRKNPVLVNPLSYLESCERSMSSSLSRVDEISLPKASCSRDGIEDVQGGASSRVLRSDNVDVERVPLWRPSQKDYYPSNVLNQIRPPPLPLPLSFPPSSVPYSNPDKVQFFPTSNPEMCPLNPDEAQFLPTSHPEMCPYDSGRGTRPEATLPCDRVQYPINLPSRAPSPCVFSPSNQHSRSLYLPDDSVLLPGVPLRSAPYLPVEGLYQCLRDQPPNDLLCLEAPPEPSRVRHRSLWKIFSPDE